jgi:hypothetical protein
LRGIRTSMFFRLFTRAPFMVIKSFSDMYLFLLDEHAKLRKIAGIIKANTFGGKEVFYVSQRGTICFPYAKRTVPHRET